MRRGILSDEAIKRMYPEHFPPDFRTHQLIFEDGADIPKHRLTGIKRSKTAHQHLKTKPRYPLHDLFLHSQAELGFIIMGRERQSSMMSMQKVG